MGSQSVRGRSKSIVPCVTQVDRAVKSGSARQLNNLVKHWSGSTCAVLVATLQEGCDYVEIHQDFAWTGGLASGRDWTGQACFTERGELKDPW